MSSWEYTETEVFRHGTREYSLFHVFGLIAVKNNVIVWAEARKGSAKDAGEIHDIAMCTSRDGGRTFGPMQIMDLGETSCYTSPTPVYDSTADRLFLFYTKNDENLRTINEIIFSDDLGKTWSEPQNINSVLEAENPELCLHIPGPGHGICLKHGGHKGRLLVQFWHLKKDSDRKAWEGGDTSSLLYSDDHGLTWQQTGWIGRDFYANESRLVETRYDLVRVMRPGVQANLRYNRYISRSTDDGMTWSDPEVMPVSPSNWCDDGAVSVSGKSGYEDMVLMSRPSCTEKRHDMEILLSTDGGRTFPGHCALPRGDAMPGYSDLCVIQEKEPVIGLLHCRCNHVLFSRISLQTVTGGQYEGTSRDVWL